MTAITDLATLIRTMQPALHPGRYVFASCPPDTVLPADALVASIREPEGLSVIIEEGAAQRAGLASTFCCVWITLLVRSDLAAVGLTAAVAAALTRAGVPSNVVAGFHHDHLFVPADAAERAMQALRELQAQAAVS